MKDLLPAKYHDKASEYEKGTDTMDVWFDSGTAVWKPCWRLNILMKNSARFQHSLLHDGFSNVSSCFISQVPLSFLFLCGNSCFSLLCFLCSNIIFSVVIFSTNLRL